MAGQKNRICFVVGAIGDPDSEIRIHADWLLEEIITPVVEGIGDFEVIRADKIASPGMIDAQVIGHLLESEIVIADLSGLNPNAFYEIGLRHMIQKPIIHMQLSEEKIPFDVSLYRAIKFSRIRPSDVRRARGDLKAALESVLAEGYKVDNPVTRAQGQINLALQASPSERVLVDQMRALQQRLTNLEARAVVGDDSPVERRFISESLIIDHEKFETNRVILLHGLLKGLFGERIRATRTEAPNTKTVADIDFSNIHSLDEMERLQNRIMEFSGVKKADLIPF